ncbi:divalent metal cation transporter, partial [Burkholderia cenocepacia]|uniref:divalent metal cation transporter n=1 Tax=Burkholderia cenocepacia TaxID=95486 RepID=UPI00114C9833
MWVVAKRRLNKVSYEDGIFDFNVGFIGTAILALVFLALGALVQYGSGEAVEQAGVKYIAQLIKMYSFAIGDWSKLLIAFIAFMCMFGTTITVIDGYSRANNEALRLLLNRKESSMASLSIWMTVTAAIGILIITVFMSDVAKMLSFAMICSFVSTPIFAALNISFVLKGEHKDK